VITGSKSPKPKDMPGGILADGMGLGKTLTMIASIIASIPQLEQSDMAKAPPKDANMMASTPVKSTLVIVPSIC
jgi:SWI/SNF-related matrix-associated actin-dependent regulator of chromatin subfamily A3